MSAFGTTLTALTTRTDRPYVHSWREAAACCEVDPELFFPEHNEAYKGALAKSICAGCPVSKECLQYAEDNQIRYGIWGGRSYADRDHKGKKKPALIEFRRAWVHVLTAHGWSTLRIAEQLGVKPEVVRRDRMALQGRRYA